MHDCNGLSEDDNETREIVCGAQQLWVPQGPLTLSVRLAHGVSIDASEFMFYAFYVSAANNAALLVKGELYSKRTSIAHDVSIPPARYTQGELEWMCLLWRRLGQDECCAVATPFVVVQDL
jgi:hypothetical protein